MPNHDYLYVSPLFEFEPFPRHAGLGHTIRHNGVIMRRLDAEYYGWLRDRIELLDKAREVGKIKAEDFWEMYARWLQIEEWCDEHVDVAKVEQYLRSKRFDPRKYKGPTEPEK